MNFDNIKYLYMPYTVDIENSDEISYTKKDIEESNLIFYYTKYIKYYKPKNMEKHNKFLNDIIVNSSKLFDDYSKEYNDEEIYNLNLSKDLKDYEKFNEIFKDKETAAETISNLILCVMYDIVDENIKNIFVNMYYLQMIDILELIELIATKFVTMEGLNKHYNMEYLNKFVENDEKFYYIDLDVDVELD